MTHPAFWLVLLPITAGFLAIIFLLRHGISVEPTFYVETHRFICPKLHREVVATVVLSRPSGKVVHVRSCTGLTDPDLVTCAEECLAAFDETD